MTNQFFTDGINDSIRKLILAKIKLNIPNNIDHPLNTAITAINRLVEHTEERPINLNEIEFLDHFLNITFITENPEDLTNLVIIHLINNNHLINEIFSINHLSSVSAVDADAQEIDFSGKQAPYGGNPDDFDHDGSIL